MQYLCLIYEAESELPSRPAEEQEAIMGEYFAFTNNMRETGKLLAGDALMPFFTEGKRFRHCRRSEIMSWCGENRS